MNIKIRKARKKDLAEIKRVDGWDQQLNSYSGLDKLDPTHEENTGTSYYKKYLLGKKKWCYVAEADGKIVGYVLFNIEKRKDFFRIKKVGYIDLLFIDKKYRKKGISKMFVNKAYEIFKKEGMEFAKLEVQTDNKDAIKVWQKHGFREYRVHMWKKL